MTGFEPPVDYALPADVPRSSRRPPAPSSGELWGGRGRSVLKAGCWVVAGLLTLPVLIPLLTPDETGADSPEQAVEQLLQGIADVDPVAVVASVSPNETEDPDRLDAAYDRLGLRLEPSGEAAPVDVALVVLALENQVGGTTDRTSLATLAAVELDLAGLELRPEDEARGLVRVHIVGGRYGVDIEPDRLPDAAGDLGRASYDLLLTEGWYSAGTPVDSHLMTVQRGGRWYVSLEASADDLLGRVG